MPGSKKLTKAEILTALAESSGLQKKAVNSLLEALSDLAKQERGSQGSWRDYAPEPREAEGEANAGDPRPPGNQPVHQRADRD